MDKTMEQKRVVKGDGGFSSEISRWAAWAKKLSPDAVASRLRADADGAVVASHILACLRKPGDKNYADALLKAAWETYGAKPFKVAMAQKSWCAYQPRSEGLDQMRLIAPAEAVAMLSSPTWAASLAEIVPQQMWERRTAAAMAWGWAGNQKVLKEAGMEIISTGPLLRMCSGSDCHGGSWQSFFVAISAHLAVPSKSEELACKVLLRHAGDERLAVFESWLESRAIGEGVEVKAAQSVRSTRRI